MHDQLQLATRRRANDEKQGRSETRSLRPNEGTGMVAVDSNYQRHVSDKLQYASQQDSQRTRTQTLRRK